AVGAGARRRRPRRPGHAGGAGGGSLPFLARRAPAFGAGAGRIAAGAAAMKALARWVALAILAFIALQLFFILRIATMAVLDPESTTFQRSEAWRIATERDKLRWRQQWVP